MTSRAVTVMTCGILAASTVIAQGQQRVTFEVVSIRQNTDAGAKPGWVTQPSGVTITAYSFFQLIAIAYDSPSIQTREQILGSPSWLKSDRFDIVAKADVPLTVDETGRPARLLGMLRSLLEDRLKLRMHTEHKEASVYLLTLANKNGTLGSRLRKSKLQDCTGLDATVAPRDSPQWCGWRGFGSGHYTIQGFTMEDFARGLASAWSIGRPLVDRTGLSGRWDLELEFIPTFVPGPNSGPIENPSADSGPDMFSALRDQLGLRLQAGKATIEYLVIDHVEKPAPD